MQGRFLTVVVLFYLATCAASAQAERSYVQAGVGHVSAGGRFNDSAGFHSSMAYSVGYQWSPSRNTSFGMVGSYLPVTVFSDSPASVFGMAAVVNYRLMKHGFTPYAGAEIGFNYLTVADSLTDTSAMNPNLAVALTIGAGLLIPISEKVEVDAVARYTYSGIGGGATLIGGTLGIRYRLR
jgi:opacity protein-like surface antigen